MIPIFGPESPYKEGHEFGWLNFLAELETWRQTPYSWLQRTKKRGTDCTSFICQALLNCGYLTRFDWPDSFRPDWYTDPDNDSLYHVLKDNFENYYHKDLVFHFIEIDELWNDFLRGDIVLFKIRKNIQVFNHSSILQSQNFMYHISAISVLEVVPFDYRWKQKAKGIFRLCFDDQKGKN